MKKLNFKMLTVVLLGIFMCSSAMAFSPHNSGVEGFGCPMKSIVFNIMGITDEQIEEAAALKTEVIEAIIPLISQMKELTISETLLAETIDTELAEDQFEDLSNITAQISAVKFDAALSGVQILTAEQRGRILTIVTFFTDFVQYLKGFPGWDMIKDLHEAYDRPEFMNKKYSYGAHGDHDFIDLTDVQKEAFKDLKTKKTELIKPLIEELKEAALEMLPLMLAETIDETAAAAKHAEINSIKAQIAGIGYDAAIEGAQILTSEQRLAILEKIQERQSWMEGDHEGCPYMNSQDNATGGHHFWASHE